MIPALIPEFFQKFLLDFGFLQFEYDIHRCKHFAIYLTWCSLSFLDLCPDFGKLFGIITLNISSVPFSLFFCYPHYAYGAHLVIVPWFSIFSSIIFALFSLCFSFGKLHLAYFQAHWFFPQLCPINWRSHQRHSSYLLVFLISSIFVLILRLPSLCLHYLSILKCCLLFPLDCLTY